MGGVGGQVHIADRQAQQLRGPQPGLGEQHDHGLVALVAKIGALARLEQAPQLVVGQTGDGPLVELGGLTARMAVASKPSSSASQLAKRLTAASRIDAVAGWHSDIEARNAITLALVSSGASPSSARNRRNSRDPGLVGPQGGRALARGLERDQPGGQQIVERQSVIHADYPTA